MACNECRHRLTRIGGRWTFKIETHQLLALTHDAQLDDRLMVGTLGKQRLDAHRPTQFLQTLTRRILPGNADQHDLGGKRCGIGRDVRGTTDALFLRIDQHHRYRRLGRDAARWPGPIAIEDQIPYHHHPRTAHGTQSWVHVGLDYSGAWRAQRLCFEGRILP